MHWRHLLNWAPPPWHWLHLFLKNANLSIRSARIRRFCARSNFYRFKAIVLCNERFNWQGICSSHRQKTSICIYEFYHATTYNGPHVSKWVVIECFCTFLDEFIIAESHYIGRFVKILRNVLKIILNLITLLTYQLNFKTSGPERHLGSCIY